MKFAWKVTLLSLCILVIALGVGSYLLISLSFHTTLEREVDVAQEEMQLLRLSYEAVCDARGVTLENLSSSSRSLQSLRRTLEEGDYFAGRAFRVSTSEGGQIYSTLDSSSDNNLLDQIDGLSSGYSIRQESPGRVLIHCAGPVALPDGTLYMETVRDISELFATRDLHYRIYRWILLAVAAASGCVMYALSRWLTRPIRSLGWVADQLAAGDYSHRAKLSGNDEIAELAGNFNHMADAIAQNIRELEEAARRQEDFTASFVHELKTPLTSIIGYADMLRSRELVEEKRFKAAGYIFSEGKRLENLSLSLMTLLVVGRSAAEIQEVDMFRLCEEAGRISQPAMADRGLTLTVRAEPGRLLGDAVLLQTLLQNLLDNARKASNPGGRVYLTGQAAGERYVLTVEDQGRGIPAEEIEKITEPFYMVDKSRSRAEGGAGLGLALCREIAGVHSGTLQFQSELGFGTRVTADLGGTACEKQE